MTTSNIENPNCRGLVVVDKLRYVHGGAVERIEVFANEHTRRGAVKGGNNGEQQTARTTNCELRAEMINTTAIMTAIVPAIVMNGGR